MRAFSSEAVSCWLGSARPECSVCLRILRRRKSKRAVADWARWGQLPCTVPFVAFKKDAVIYPEVVCLMWAWMLR
eukprot:1933470-Alexandrium_andersonii.AAC.1